MAKAIFIWDEENVPHIAEHGLTPEEVETVVNNPKNDFDLSNSTGRGVMFGRTKTSKYILVAFDQHGEKPWTVRVTTAYEVPRPRRR